MKEETVWSFERLQSYIDEHHTKDKGLAENWMFTTFTVSRHWPSKNPQAVTYFRLRLSNLLIFYSIETNAANHADMFSQCSEEVASKERIFWPSWIWFHDRRELQGIETFSVSHAGLLVCLYLSITEHEHVFLYRFGWSKSMSIHHWIPTVRFSKTLFPLW